MTRLLELALVFEEACRLVRRPGNDFMWSGWEDAADALAELEPIAAQLRVGYETGTSLYFLPTGPLQELSLSSGWGDEFVALADRYDTALGIEDSPPCGCELRPDLEKEPVRAVGSDDHFADIEILRCPRCERLWLRYFYENEAFALSGRWFMGEVSPHYALAISPSDARKHLESLPDYFFGGSYFDGQSGKASGPITL